MKNEFYLLAADIGATNSRFALFEANLASINKLEINSFPNLYLRKEHWLKSKDYKTFASLLTALHSFSQENNFLPDKLSCACIAVPGPVEPGPVEDECCYPPNINWTIHASEVNQILGLEHTFLINDFVAQGYACMLARSPQSREKFELETVWQPKLNPHVFTTPSQGYKKNKAKQNSPSLPVAILGAGSGLGKAVILEDLQTVLPSEGGHGDFPFIGSKEFAYAEFLKQTYGMASVENDQIINGSGLARLYDYHAEQLRFPHILQSKGKPPYPKPSAHEVSTLLRGDISQNLAAQLTLEWYARFYGRICKNFALETMPLGGLYITGGMACRVPALQHPAFLQSLQCSNTQKRLLEKIPVVHIQSQQAGLRGAALFGALQYLKTLPL